MCSIIYVLLPFNSNFFIIVINLLSRNYYYSYQILAPTEMYNEKDPKKSAKLCFDKIGLDPELYRIGHTKASKKPQPHTLRMIFS